MRILVGAWLGARELRVRWPRVLLAAAVVAVLGGAAVTMELLARAREEAIAARIDSMGPPLTIVPAGTTSEALGRYDLRDALLPEGTPGRVEAALGAALRRTEARLVLGVEVNDRRVPLVGLPGEAWPRDLAGSAAVVVGAEIEGSFPPGDSVPLGGESLPVVSAFAAVGTIDDAALFVPLAVAQRLAGTAAVNEVRVYLRAGVQAEEAEARLRGAIPGAKVIRHDRGSVAGSEAQTSLAAHRRAAYGMLAAVALLCLLIAAHLDAAERRLELATFVAIGAPPSAILSALLLRSVITAVAGSVLGAVGGVVVVAAQDPVVSTAWYRWLDVGGIAIACAIGVAAFASLAVGVPALLRNPVRDLQEA